MLGYDIHPAGGRLVVNEQEAERVRAIFALFEEHRSVLLTLTAIEQRGWRLKSWTRKSGEFRSGASFAPNSLRRLLVPKPNLTARAFHTLAGGNGWIRVTASVPLLTASPPRGLFKSSSERTLCLVSPFRLDGRRSDAEPGGSVRLCLQNL
ncbi:MAG: Resolvase, N-terminal domain [Bryobacterales bacterium]|nr:Resolvase, N-terminal domain [Bryobacterales bacterium]